MVPACFGPSCPREPGLIARGSQRSTPEARARKQRSRACGRSSQPASIACGRFAAAAGPTERWVQEEGLSRNGGSVLCNHRAELRRAVLIPVQSLTLITPGGCAIVNSFDDHVRDIPDTMLMARIDGSDAATVPVSSSNTSAYGESMRSLVLSAVLVASTLPALAEAQPVDSVENLWSRMKSGNTVYVTDASARETRGIFCKDFRYGADRQR